MVLAALILSRSSSVSLPCSSMEERIEGAALIQSTQADEFIGDDADLFIIKRAGHFFTVAGNKRNGVAIVQQVDHRSQPGMV